MSLVILFTLLKVGKELIDHAFRISRFLILGRIDPSFYDENESIIGEIIQRYPDAKSMEMETFILMHLANCSSVGIAASAAAIVVRCFFIPNSRNPFSHGVF